MSLIIKTSGGDVTIPTSATINVNTENGTTAITKIDVKTSGGITTVWQKVTAGFKYWNHSSGSSPSVSRTFTAAGGYYFTQSTGWHHDNGSMTLSVAGVSQSVTSQRGISGDKFNRRVAYNTSTGDSVVCNASAWGNSSSYGNVSMITYQTGSLPTCRATGGSTDSNTGSTSYTLTENCNVVVVVTGYKSTTTPTTKLAGTTKSVSKTETSGDFRYWIWEFTGTSGQQITVSHKANASYGNTVCSIWTY